MFSIGVLGFIVWAHGRLDKLDSWIVLKMTPRPKLLSKLKTCKGLLLNI